jgi:hypothetical protein
MSRPAGGPPFRRTVISVLKRCQSLVGLLHAALVLGGVGTCGVNDLVGLKRWVYQGLQRSALLAFCLPWCQAMESAVASLMVVLASTIYREDFLRLFPEIIVTILKAIISVCCTTRSGHAAKQGYTCNSPGLGPKAILCSMG